MTTNTALWDSVETTPPSKTKAITGKPYKGTSPQPYYLIRRATEVFGPCGIGWGFTIIDERLEDGSPNVRIHIARVRVWYEWNGKRGEVEHVGQTVFCGSNKNGPFTDEDAPKKSVTDALVKALSLIGFAGDIFSGRYDDSKYVNSLVDEAAKPTQPAQDPLAVALSRIRIAHSRDDLKAIKSELAPITHGWPAQDRETLNREFTNAWEKAA